MEWNGFTFTNQYNGCWLWVVGARKFNKRCVCVFGGAMESNSRTQWNCVGLVQSSCNRKHNRILCKNHLCEYPVMSTPIQIRIENRELFEPG
jgi:hypothetical protein